MNRFQRTIASVSIAILGVVGVVGSSSGSTPVEAQTQITQAGIGTQALLEMGPLDLYQTNFTSDATCKARAAYLMKVCGKYQVGGMAATSCQPETIPGFGASTTRYNLYVRYWFAKGGPLLVDPALAPSNEAIVVAAC